MEIRGEGIGEVMPTDLGGLLVAADRRDRLGHGLLEAFQRGVQFTAIGASLGQVGGQLPVTRPDLLVSLSLVIVLGRVEGEGGANPPGLGRLHAPIAFLRGGETHLDISSHGVSIFLAQ
jgi:hypothetical protein